MKKHIILIFSLIVCLIHFDVYGGNRPDYKGKLEKELTIIFFSPELAERCFLKLYSRNREVFDVEYGAQIYNNMVQKNGGYMSVDDLFFICKSTAKKWLGKDKKQDFQKHWKKYVLDACKYDFILPLVDMTEEELFIDEALIEVYDGTAFDKKCTEPAYAEQNEGAINMVCTTGEHRDSDPAFEKAMITKFRLEGGCKDVHDGNGLTCFGVASAYYPQVKEPTFTRADAEDIAYTDFYTKHNINKLPDAIRGDVFMALWGTGKTWKSIGLLQDILGVRKTNTVDTATIKAAQNYKGNLRKRFLKARWENMKDDGRFSDGWAKAFLTYLKNGCHSRTETPLLRTKETMDECKKHL